MFDNDDGGMALLASFPEDDMSLQERKKNSTMLAFQEGTVG